MKSVAQAPELRLSRLQKLIERFKAPPSLRLYNRFKKDSWPSDTIDWQSETGDRGLTPFSGENIEAPRVAPTGTAEHSAKAAFWKEKMYLASKFLNNICSPQNTNKYYRAAKYIAKQTRMLKHRCLRRGEWMIAKVFNAGSFSYKDPDGNSISVDYGIPTTNKVTLGTTSKWNYTGSDATVNILGDIMDAQDQASNLFSGEYTHALFTSEVLRVMVENSGIQNLLQKSTFGNGDLFVNPTKVLGSLLNIKNMELYNESYRIKAWLTSGVAAGAGSHTIYGDNFTDFEVGMTLTMVDVSLKTNNLETLTITAVDVVAGTVTATGTLARAYKASTDFCYVTKKFIDPTKFILYTPKVEDENIIEFAEAPFALSRHWGLMIDKKDTWDPDGLYVRAQNKGIPVLYFPDAIYQLTVIG